MKPRVGLLVPGTVMVMQLMVSCSGEETEPATKQERPPMKITLTSSAFSDGQPIPSQHTCDGADTSPSLSWVDVPPAAKSLALICDDPDAPAGTWVHWVLYNLPATLAGLPEGIPATEKTAQGGQQGLNDFRRVGYGGPCPPPGKPHRYYFKVYALDRPVELGAKATKQDLVRAMKGHILGEGALLGTYQRKK